MNKPAQIYTTYIRSTPEKTWEAITKPEFTRQYWGGMTNVSDWKKGSRWQLVNPQNETWITGEVVESIPPKRLVLSWADPDALKDVSRVQSLSGWKQDSTKRWVIWKQNVDSELGAVVSGSATGADEGKANLRVISMRASSTRTISLNVKSCG